MSSTAADAERAQAYLAEVRPGAILDQKYRIEHSITEGGMGAVYAARHVQLGMKLAVKVILPRLVGEDEAIRRFGREARAAAKITNDHVVRILDVGELQSGAPYMVMEFLEGQNGATYLEVHAPLSIDDVIDFAVQACTALAAAHALGIIHRDLKPSNLVFVPRPNGRPLVKVLDFGLSKIVSADGHESASLTKSGWGLGSPAYASPEQWRDSRRADKRSDIWAIGVILYEFSTRAVPFNGPNVALMGMNVAGADPIPPRELRADIPADLERIVLKCLAKNADDRFQHVEALSKALRACQDRQTALGSGSTPRERRSALSIAFMGTFALIALTATAVIGTSLYSGGLAPTQHPRANATPLNPSVVGLVPVPSVTPQSASSNASASQAQSAPTPAPKVTASATRHSAAPADARAPLAGESVRRGEAGKSVGTSRCDPPYYFDPQGNRLYKVDCL
jgi:serine/threonine protein kinase